MMLSEKELTSAEVKRIWAFYQSKDKDLDILVPPEKAIWQNAPIIEFESEDTFVLEQTDINGHVK